MTPLSRLVAFFRRRRDNIEAAKPDSRFAGHRHVFSCLCKTDRDGRYHPDPQCVVLTRLAENRERFARRMNGG